LTDPQTSGGLLIACTPERTEEIVRTIVADGYPFARVIGRIEAGPPRIRVEA
jgi:selenide,water dikinase